MTDFRTINDDLETFVKFVPTNGSYIVYLNKARVLMNLYDEAVSIMEDVCSVENERKVEKIAKEIRRIVCTVEHDQIKHHSQKEKVKNSNDRTKHAEWPSERYFQQYEWPSEFNYSCDHADRKSTGCGIFEITESLEEMVKNIWSDKNQEKEELFKADFIDKSPLFNENYKVNGNNFDEFIDTYSLVLYILKNYVGTDTDELVYDNVYGADEKRIAHHCLRDSDGNIYEYYEKTVYDPYLDYTSIEAWFIMNDKFLVDPVNKSLIWDII